MVERKGEYAVRDLGPERIVFPKPGKGLHRRLALVSKGTAGANGSRKGIVALADQVRQLERGTARIESLDEVRQEQSSQCPEVRAEVMR